MYYPVKVYNHLNYRQQMLCDEDIIYYGGVSYCEMTPEIYLSVIYLVKHTLSSNNWWFILCEWNCRLTIDDLFCVNEIVIQQLVFYSVWMKLSSNNWCFILYDWDCRPTIDVSPNKSQISRFFTSFNKVELQYINLLE